MPFVPPGAAPAGCGGGGQPVCAGANLEGTAKTVISFISMFVRNRNQNQRVQDDPQALMGHRLSAILALLLDQAVCACHSEPLLTSLLLQWSPWTAPAETMGSASVLATTSMVRTCSQVPALQLCIQGAQKVPHLVANLLTCCTLLTR